MCDHISSLATANPKHQNFPSQSLTVGTYSKRQPPVSDCDHFLGLTVDDFPWFSTSCKRPLDTFCDLYVVCTMLLNINEELTTWNYTRRNLDIACNKLSSIK